MEIFKLFGSIFIKDEDALKALDNIDKKGANTGDKFGKMTEKVGNGVQSVGKVMLGAGATITGAMTGIVMKGSEWSAQVEGQRFLYNNLDKAIQNSISSNAENARSIGLTNQQYKNGATTVATYYKNMGLTAEETAKLSGETMNLVADLGAVVDVPFDDALGDFKSALMGNYEAVDKYGINLSASTLENSEFVKSLGKSWNQLSDNEKMMAAYNEILRQSSPMQGLASQEAESFGMQLKLLKESVGEVVGKLGAELLPVLEPVIQSFAEAVEKVTKWVEENPELTRTILIIVGALGIFLTTLGALLIPIGGLIIAVTTFNVAMLPTIGTVLAIVGAIGVLIAIGVALWMNWDTICKKAKEIWTAICDVVINTWNSITEWTKSTWETIITWLSEKWNGLCEIVSTVWQTICNLITMAFLFIGQIISFGWQLITLPFQLIWQNCKDFLIEVWNSISAYLLEVWANISTKCSEVWNSVVEFFANTWNSISTKVSEVWNNIVLYLTGVWTNISTKCSEVWNNIVLFFSNIWNSISSKCSEVWNNIKSILSNIWNGIKSIATNTFNNLKNSVSNTWNRIKDAIINPLNRAKEAVKNAIDKIKGFFNFSWELPKLKLPHISIKGKFSLNPVSVPSFGVEYYKDGGIMTTPTAFGMNPRNGKTMIGGEAGAEAILPLSELPRLMKEMGYIPSGREGQPIIINIDGKKVFEAMSPHMGRSARSW